MKAPNRRNRQGRFFDAALLASLLLLLTPTLHASTGELLILKRGEKRQQSAEVKGLVRLAIDPGIESAKVRVEVDGQVVSDHLMSPWQLKVDFGPRAIEHRITVTAKGARGATARWTETFNLGNLPLTLQVRPVELSSRTFEAVVTAPEDDPVTAVQLWDEGTLVTTVEQPPWRFEVPERLLASGVVQVSARTASGEEAADFWAAGERIHVDELQIRTVPIFVSVVNRKGETLDDVDRSQFRIIDNDTEAKIVEFGKAFDQPISIALLLDASASMTHSMKHAAKAASEFVEKTLKQGDRCSITAVQDVPRRKQSLTDDRTQIAAALDGIVPQGATALNDAVASAIRELRDEKNRRAIVVLTDGEDNSSNYSWDEIQTMARQSAIPIYFIAYEGAEETARSLDRLRYLAAETGGFVAAATQQNLMARYEAIERDLRAQFAIRYQIADFARSNQYRKVRVVLDSPTLTARTIKGYITP